MQTKNSVPGWIKGTVLILTTLALFSCSGPTDRQLVQTAKEYLSQAKMRAAALELKNALQKNPKNAQARYLLGEIDLKTGDLASAEKEFKRAANAGWSEAKTQIALARVLLDRHAYQQLLDDIKVKNSYQPDARANLYALRALAQAALKHTDKAGTLLAKATVLDPNALYVLKAAIQIQLAKGDLAGANESLKQALVTYGKNQEILILSALVAINNKNLAAAATAYEKVITLEPRILITFYGGRARLGLARLEILKGKLDKAQAALKPLFKYNANDPETNYVGGLLAFKQGKLGLAEKRLLLVLKVAPEYIPTQLLFGAVSYAQHHYEQAAYYLARYVSAEPGNLGARKLLGRTYIRLGQHKKAQLALQPGLKDNRGDAELLALIGLSQLQAGNTASGIRGLEQAVKAAPENLALKSELARAYIATGETKNAITTLNTVLARGGENRQAQVLLITAQIKDRQYDQAIDVVLSMLRKKPNDPAVLSLAGNVFAISNDRAEAHKYFNRALKVKPGYIPATMLLARLEELEGHADKARQLYKNLAQMHKKDINSLMALARLAELQKRPADMVKWLQQASQRSVQDIRSRKVLIEYYLREKQLRKAGQVLKEAMNIAPGNNSLLDLQARLQIAQGQYNAALLSLNKLVTKVPDSAYARTLLAEVYLKLGKSNDARHQLKIVLEKQPYYVAALILRANLALKSGQFNKVLADAIRIQKVRPGLYQGYELAGDVAMNKKDYAAANISYNQAWKRKPSAELAIKMSINSTRSGKYTDAKKPLLIWLNNHPENTHVLQFLGTAYQSLKQDSKAIKTFERLLAIQPNNAVALNNLAWFYLVANNPKALKLATRAYKASPKNSGVQDTYGWALLQHGQIDKGLKMMKQVIKVLPDVPEVQYHYAVALMKSGEKQKARKILTKLLKDNKFFVGHEEARALLN